MGSALGAENNNEGKMAGAVEEGAKVATGFIAALGSQPVLLVQAAIIGGIVFILYAQGTRSFTEREVLLKSVFESQQNVREILSRCIVPDRRSDNEHTDIPSNIKNSNLFKVPP
jgi:hypothetical protein